MSHSLLRSSLPPAGAAYRARAGLTSECAKERHELRLLLLRERRELREDGALDRGGAPVAQEGGEEPGGTAGFGPYRLDRASGRLLRGTNVPLRLKTFAVLEYLATRPGRQAATRGPRRARYRNRGKGRSRKAR